MIPIRGQAEIDGLRKSAALLVKAFKAAESILDAGVTTEELDWIVEKVIVENGGKPAFKGYRGYPASICTSIDEEVVHGIPSSRACKEGEIIGLDIGVELNGFFSDAAKTYGIGRISEEKKRLKETTHAALFRGIRQCRKGKNLYDISHAIQTMVESRGFSVVRDLVGHGIGTSLHEEPQIPNFGPPKQGPKLYAGMVFAIEPMINMGVPEVKFLKDGWTVVTADRQPSAHFEHTVLITDSKPEILTFGIEGDWSGRENG